MKILVAVDPSDSALLPVSRAAAMAKKEGAELTLLAVAEAVEDMESLFGATATDRLREKASKALGAAKALAKAAGVEAKEILDSGVSPEEIIVDAAQKGGFDLIVMGTRGKKGARKLFLGSVAAKVIALAPCSVLVVR
ncbi:MAG: universal stress protein [Humidesulfovibrio sp.]|uniref:universal stress protein n=1 Tax=Humidesulfovibrio sp. TaxID=2910988 RepID=UPI0027369215|nr:universal stress protein [Humidesulfovibrio sp.]MDP2849320.1 universal stress protein [Humidesulfovibrio sp.]